MRDLAVLSFVSIDGVMQAPVKAEEDPSGNFTSAGWALPYWEQVMPTVRREAMSEPYDLLLGRRTYDIFSGKALGKNSENEAMRSQRKYVATKHPDKADWDNSEALSGNVSAQIQDLKSTEGPLLQIHGSWELIQSMLAHDIIDEFRLWTFPVVLGRGKRLFENSPPSSLVLKRSLALPNGVTMGVYRRAN